MILYILFIIVLFFLFLNKGTGVEGFTQDTVMNNTVNSNMVNNKMVNMVNSNLVNSNMVNNNSLINSNDDPITSENNLINSHSVNNSNINNNLVNNNLVNSQTVNNSNVNNSNVNNNPIKTISKSKQQKFENKKCLLVYYGGSFREGNIGTTISDTKYGYESQKHASISHAKLKRVLNERGYQTDILVNTRHTEYKDDLMNWYNPFNIILNNIPKRMHGKDYMIQSCIENINKLNKEDYNFIFFVRIDLFLKPDFYKILDTESNKIMFLANNYNPRNCKNIINKHGDPEVVDLFIYIPKKYYYILDNKFKLEHNSWVYYKKQYNLNNNDMTFMTTLKFDSNSIIDNNPYYVMGSRKENSELHINMNMNTCPKYMEKKQKYIENPTQYYLNKYTNFYLV